MTYIYEPDTPRTKGSYRQPVERKTAVNHIEMQLIYRLDRCLAQNRKENKGVIKVEHGQD